MPQPYEVLGVGENPTWEEVRQAYLKLSLEYHPDLHSNDGEYYNIKMAEVNAAYDYYKCCLDKKAEQGLERESPKAYKDYTEDEKRRFWEEMKAEWKLRSQAAYRESGMRMREKLARNLEPIMEENKAFKKSISKYSSYDDLLNLATSYADKIENMIETMYEYTEKYHRYGMPPHHEYHTEIHDENVDRNYPLHEVISSQIKAIGYDESNQLLYVQFNSGSMYVYYGVVKYVYDGFLKATSKGRYLDKYIKKVGYKYTRLK